MLANKTASMSEIRKKAMSGTSAPSAPALGSITPSPPMPQKATPPTPPSLPKVAFDLEAVSSLLMDGEKAAGEILSRCQP